MELTISYLIKSGLCLLALYLFYYGLLRKQSSFGFNRLFLLLSPVIALMIPFLKWPTFLSTETAVAQSLQAVQLPEIILTTQSSVTKTEGLFNNVSLEYILFSFYMIGAGFLFFKLSRQLLNIRNLALTATPAEVKLKNITVLQTPDHTPTFAFLNYIFVSRQSHLTELEEKQVLDHEIAHVQLRHTWDILFYEVLTVLVWFNQVIWLLKNELRDVHEYQADARVLTKHQVNHYSSLLAKEVLYKSGIPVGSYFKEPQVIKRLQMLRCYGKRSGWVRPALMLPLLGTLAFLFSSQQLSGTLQAAVSPNIISTLTEEKPGIKVDKVETEANADITFTEPVKEAPASTAEAEQLPEKKLVNPPLPTISEQEAETPDIAKQEEKEKPYTYVEKMPGYEGGDAALLEFFKNNMAYPETAKEAGEEGIVVIEFTVGTDGKLSNYKLVKGISEEIDTEAMRLVKLTNGKWKAGSQNGRIVPVRFIIPIQFRPN